MSRFYSKDPLIDRSLRHSVRDAVAYSVMSGAGETYFSAFAVFLKATTAQIGWLASLPPLLGSFAQLLSAWLGRRLRSRRRVILAGAWMQCIVLLPLALLPVLYPDHAVPLLIAGVILYYAAANLIVPQWSSLMGDLVPERRRGRFFARRTAVASITAFGAVVGAGILLHEFDDYGLALFGYIALFLIAAGARMVSIYHLGRMHDPPGRLAAIEIPSDLRWLRRLRRSAFVRFSLFFALMQFSVAIASPFFTLYMLRDLQFTYLQFMANTATSVLVQFMTLTTWGRLSDAFGNRLILAITGFLIPIMPVLWVFSTDFWYLIAMQAFGGLGWAGFSLSAGNFLYDLVPTEKRATYLALHNVTASVGIFCGALIGGYLGTVLPTQIDLGGQTYTWLSALYGVFVISTVCRYLVAFTFLPRIREVRTVRPISVTQLIFRVTRFNALSGLIFDIIGTRRRKDSR